MKPSTLPPRSKLHRATGAALRRGLTIMEVLFAIGVVLVGLLGLASIIPLAAREAKQTLEADRSTADATAILDRLKTESVFSPDRLYLIDDNPNDAYRIEDRVSTTATNPLSQTGRYSLSAMRPSANEGTYAANDNRINPRFDLRVRQVFDSPGFSQLGLVRPAGIYGSICIDPRFATPPGSTPTNYFRASRFPYYTERTNPMLSPQSAETNANSWALSPRMWRAGMLADPSMVPSPGFPSVEYHINNAGELVSAARSRQLSTAAQIESIFLLGNDLVWQRSAKDRSLDIVPYFSEDRSDSTGFNAGGRLASNRYSWIATISPSIAGGPTPDMSVVVIEGRDLPAFDNTSNPPQERLTWVGKAIGFSEGSGGDIQIFGSNAVSTSVKSGQWIMLSRQVWGRRIPRFTGDPTPPLLRFPFYGTIPATGEPSGAAAHRWYKVVNVDEAIPGANPHGNDVWSRWVTLAGPDWNFGVPDPVSTSPTFGYLERESGTFCTIVDGAIAVITAASPISL